MIFITYGKPIKVIKKTEYGIIVLFNTESKIDTDSRPSPKKVKLEEEGEKIVLCGTLCEEITSPFLNFDLRIEFKKGNLYKVLAINSIVRDFNVLTPSVIRKTLKNTEYFGIGDYANFSMKQELEDLFKLGCTFIFESKPQIDALIGRRYSEIHAYIFKNIFRGSAYLKILEIYGKNISEENIDVLETILIGEIGPPLDKLENLFCSLFVGNAFWDTLSQTLDPDVLDSPRIALARRSFQILHNLTGEAPLPYHIVQDKDLCAYLETRPGIKIIKIESSNYVFLENNADSMEKVASSLKNIRDLNLIQVECDTDHDEPSGYFDWIRTQFGHQYDNFAILYTLEKRKYYLRGKTGLPVISLQDLKTSKKPIPHLLIDRCHVLNFNALGAILTEIKDTTTSVYFAGSLFCYPEKSMGIAVFTEIYNSKLRATRMKLSGDLPLERKVTCCAVSISALTTTLAPPYSIFTKTLASKKKLNVKCPIFYEREIRYSMPSQEKIFINLEDSMNLHDIAKYFMCSTVARENIYIVGSQARFSQICKRRNNNSSLFLKMFNE